MHKQRGGLAAAPRVCPGPGAFAPAVCVERYFSSAAQTVSVMSRHTTYGSMFAFGRRSSM